MKPALVIVSALGVAMAQFPGVPQCAVNCLLPAIPSTGCAKDDIHCLCSHVNVLSDAIKTCVLKACNADEIKKALAIMTEKCK